MSIKPSERLRSEKNTIVSKYAIRSNTAGYTQLLNTLIPFFSFFYLAMASVQVSYWLSAGFIVLIVPFLLRIFMLMHDCGHGSLFRTPLNNNIWGFILGVLCGMPQYVWAQHHNYHHSTNGNWSKYRGPLDTLSTEQFSKLSIRKQRFYQYSRNIFNAPLGGFMYFIFSPRFTCMVGTFKLLNYIAREKAKDIKTPIKTIASNFKTKFWSTRKEYWHMCGNNFFLLGTWLTLSLIFGAEAFFFVYILSVALAGACGIIIFTIQHNFESSYASEDEGWDYYEAALKGTSYLVFPPIVNWFTADIAYHNVHHLSARIPNYNLAKCYREHSHLFETATRIRLGDIPKAFQHILWDTKARKIISIKQYKENINLSNT